MGGKSSKSGGSRRSSKTISPFDPSNELKLMLTGDKGIGKSSLLRSFLEKAGLIDSIKIDEEYSQCKIDVGSEMKWSLQIWDPPQSKHKRLSPGYYSKCRGILVCFDLSNRESFENTRDWWLNDITMYAPDVSCVLVGLKSDLPAATQAGEITKLAKQFEVPYVAASTLQGSGALEAFAALAKEAVGKSVKIVEQESSDERKRLIANAEAGYSTPPSLDSNSQTSAASTAASLANVENINADEERRRAANLATKGTQAVLNEDFKEKHYWKDGWSRAQAEEAIDRAGKDNLGLVRPSSKLNAYAVTYKKNGKTYHTPIVVQNNSFCLDDHEGMRQSFSTMDAVLNFLQITPIG